jgi:hypothetical protein
VRKKRDKAGGGVRKNPGSREGRGCIEMLAGLVYMYNV